MLETASGVAKALGVELATIKSYGRAFDDKQLRKVEKRFAGLRQAADCARRDRVVFAFKAADDAIQHSLSRTGEYGTSELTAVLSLLATHYGCSTLETVRVAFEQGMTIPDTAFAENGDDPRGERHVASLDKS